MTAGARRLVEEIGGFATDPYGHALFAYLWREPGPLAELDGPRRWQGEVLREIGDHLSNPATRFTPKRIAVAKGHGIGGSALIAMIVNWSLDTCVDTRVVTTANTEAQLVSKTSPELAKWRNLSVTRDWFKTAALSHVSTQPGHSQSWRCDLLPWSPHQPEAFAGLHNAGRRIVLIFDEASSIPDRIWEVSDGALTDEGTEIIHLVVGNPTRNSGRFRDAFARYRNLWSCRQIDSRTVEGTNKIYLDEIVATYGEDSDIAKVRVRGLFPSASSMQFIGMDVVGAARSREPQANPPEPIIFGIDHARFGDDDSVLAIRQGRDAKSRPWRSWSGANSMEIAGDVTVEASRWNPDAIFVDAGGPNAGGVIDRLRQLLGPTPVFEVNFGGKGRPATLSGEIRANVANKRAEMWTNMRAWLERGAIPDHQRLADDLVGPEYSYVGENAILLERKAHMRARGLASSDWADALALTFAEPVLPRFEGGLHGDDHGPRCMHGLRFGDVRRAHRIAPDPARDLYAELYRERD
ncbi:MAG: terminase [Sphingomicrobium sp.]